MLTVDDINNLARLARIELSEEEKVRLQKDMESILGYVGQITAVAVEQKERPSPESKDSPSAHDLINIMRDDVVTTETGEYTEAVLANAPKREGDYFSVKPIFEDR